MKDVQQPVCPVDVDGRGQVCLRELCRVVQEAALVVVLLRYLRLLLRQLSTFPPALQSLFFDRPDVYDGPCDAHLLVVEDKSPFELSHALLNTEPFLL